MHIVEVPPVTLIVMRIQDFFEKNHLILKSLQGVFYVGVLYLLSLKICRQTIPTICKKLSYPFLNQSVEKLFPVETHEINPKSLSLMKRCPKFL